MLINCLCVAGSQIARSKSNERQKNMKKRDLAKAMAEICVAWLLEVKCMWQFQCQSMNPRMPVASICLQFSGDNLIWRMQLLNVFCQRRGFGFVCHSVAVKTWVKFNSQTGGACNDFGCAQKPTKHGGSTKSMIVCFSVHVLWSWTQPNPQKWCLPTCWVKVARNKIWCGQKSSEKSSVAMKNFSWLESPNGLNIRGCRDLEALWSLHEGHRHSNRYLTVKKQPIVHGAKSKSGSAWNMGLRSGSKVNASEH